MIPQYLLPNRNQTNSTLGNNFIPFSPVPTGNNFNPFVPQQQAKAPPATINRQTGGIDWSPELSQGPKIGGTSWSQGQLDYFKANPFALGGFARKYYDQAQKGIKENAFLQTVPESWRPFVGQSGLIQSIGGAGTGKGNTSFRDAFASGGGQYGIPGATIDIPHWVDHPDYGFDYNADALGALNYDLGNYANPMELMRDPQLLARNKALKVINEENLLGDPTWVNPHFGGAPASGSNWTTYGSGIPGIRGYREATKIYDKLSSTGGNDGKWFQKKLGDWVKNHGYPVGGQQQFDFLDWAYRDQQRSRVRDKQGGFLDNLISPLGLLSLAAGPIGAAFNAPLLGGAIGGLASGFNTGSPIAGLLGAAGGYLGAGGKVPGFGGGAASPPSTIPSSGALGGGPLGINAADLYNPASLAGDITPNIGSAIPANLYNPAALGGTIPNLTYGTGGVGDPYVPGEGFVDPTQINLPNPLTSPTSQGFQVPDFPQNPTGQDPTQDPGQQQQIPPMLPPFPIGGGVSTGPYGDQPPEENLIPPLIPPILQGIPGIAQPGGGGGNLPDLSLPVGEDGMPMSIPANGGYKVGSYQGLDWLSPEDVGAYFSQFHDTPSYDPYGAD